MVRTELLDLVDQTGRVRRVLTCEESSGLPSLTLRVKTMAPTDQ